MIICPGYTMVELANEASQAVLIKMVRNISVHTTGEASDMSEVKPKQRVLSSFTNPFMFFATASYVRHNTQNVFSRRKARGKFGKLKCNRENEFLKAIEVLKQSIIFLELEHTHRSSSILIASTSQKRTLRYEGFSCVTRTLKFCIFSMKCLLYNSAREGFRLLCT